MTREELQKLVDDNPWYNGMACGIGLRRILTHDAEQRAEIAWLREALTNCKRELWHCNKQLVTNGWNEGGSVTRALEQAQQALKETTT